MIPKIIHYIWIGGKPKPDLILRCIESWKKFCPDYEIREWNDDDAAKIDNHYMREALAAKKYAFASDVIRLHALKNEGGFYLDTDVELTQSIDKMRQYDFVSGYEDWQGIYAPIVSAFMGATKENNIINDLISEYEKLSFIVDGEPDLTPNTARITAYFKRRFGINEPYDNHATTRLGNNGIIFPSYFFCLPEEGKENYAIHHFNASWHVHDNYKRKNIISICHHRLALFKRLFTQDEDKYPMRPNEIWLKKWHIGGDTVVALLKKERK